MALCLLLVFRSVLLIVFEIHTREHPRVFTSSHADGEQLVESDFFSDQILYRTMPDFLVQFGVASDPQVQAKWSDRQLKDDAQQHIPFRQV